MTTCTRYLLLRLLPALHRAATFLREERSGTSTRGSRKYFDSWNSTDRAAPPPARYTFVTEVHTTGNGLFLIPPQAGCGLGHVKLGTRRRGHLVIGGSLDPVPSIPARSTRFETTVRSRVQTALACVADEGVESARRYKFAAAMVWVWVCFAVSKVALVL